MNAKRFLIAICMIILGTSIFARQVTLSVTVSNPYVLADQRQNVYLKVGLTGFEMNDGVERPPANVAIVLDRSGSMEGEKIARAKEAANIAVDMLSSRDIVSIITYSDTVTVLVPATRVTDKRSISRKIESIYSDGSTALFAGVSKGADEVSEYFDRNKVNRVILLSDGLANVGPDSPRALGNLGEALKRDGISVTTIGLGLGYNEDLMVELAQRSDGNHAFVENYKDLTRIFQYELGDIMSVVAQDVGVEIICPEGIKPLRILGREAEIIGNRVYTTIGQLYSNQEKYLLIELDVSPNREGASLNVADVKINYDNMSTKAKENLSGSATVAFTRSQTTVEQTKDAKTLVEAVKQIAVETKEEAIQLRDEGRVEEAAQLLQANTEFIMKQAESLKSPELQGMGSANSVDADAIQDDEAWNANRKRMKADSYEVQNQQSY